MNNPQDLLELLQLEFIKESPAYDSVVLEQFVKFSREWLHKHPVRSVYYEGAGLGLVVPSDVGVIRIPLAAGEQAIAMSDQIVVIQTNRGS
jgi:hypothetical protein